MQNLTRNVTNTVFFALIFFCFTKTILAQDTIKIDSTRQKVELKNRQLANEYQAWPEKVNLQTL